MKNNPCPICKGRGYRKRLDTEPPLYPEYGYIRGVYNCEACDGTGRKKEPVSNENWEILKGPVSTEELMEKLRDKQ